MGITPEKLAHIRRVSQRQSSLQAPVGEDGMELGELIADEKSLDPGEATDISDMLNHLDEALEGLTPEERMIIEMRFGLNDFEPHTL